VSKAGKKLTFYVDTECVFSNENRCSYYMSKQVQKQAGNSAQLVWGRKCCPIVYLKTAREKFAAFCPTQGGPWGEHLPILSGPGPKAVKIEIIPRSDESWAEIIEKAAKMACEARS
jgi:hypothetical protein